MASIQGPRVLAFVDAFCTEGTPAFGNATEAALAAGYAPDNRKSAREIGSQLRAKPAVQKLIAERLAGAGVTGDALRLRVGGVAFSEPGKKWTGSEIIAACNLLAKMTPNAIAPTKTELTGALGVTWEALVPKRKPPTEGER